MTYESTLTPDIFATKDTASPGDITGLVADLAQPIEAITSLSTSQKKLFQKWEKSSVFDIVTHAPSALIDRRARGPIAHAAPDSIVTLEVRVVGHQKPFKRSQPHTVLCEDESGIMRVIFFRVPSPFIEKSLLPIGQLRRLSGKVVLNQGTLSMAHPDYITPLDGTIPELEVVYPLVQGIKLQFFRRLLINCLTRVRNCPEWSPYAHKRGWPSFREALEKIHHPTDPSHLLSQNVNRQRLAYEEFYLYQYQLLKIKQERHRQKSAAITCNKESAWTSLLSQLPFSLTGAQVNACKDIRTDFENAHSQGPMVRMLQGDVGSGKTIVAQYAALMAIEAGWQVALMAPTEILAHQHLKTFSQYPINNVCCALLKSATRASERKAYLKDLKEGSLNLLIGTHALFQKDVVFKNLGLCIIDEQHRFGTAQREALLQKNKEVVPHLLLMSATPIPRTLNMLQNGHISVSFLHEKPQARQPIETALLSLENIEHLLTRLKALLASNNQVYWVCPLVEESEKSDLAAAQERFKHLKDILKPHPIGLIHGQMTSQEKATTMQAFSNKELKLLVATSVVEVGVDVPSATCMIIEHAERFGLSQLHQLRGRVGRSAHLKAFCILLYRAPLSFVAQKRLLLLRESEDGFLLAEQDLELRGPGDLMGLRQSGIPHFLFFSLNAHYRFTNEARKEAGLFLKRNLPPPLQKLFVGQNTIIL